MRPIYEAYVMIISSQSAITWVVALTSISVFIQTMELLTLRESVQAEGIWSWKTISSDFASFSFPIRSLVNFLMSYQVFLGLIIFRLLSSLICFAYPHPVFFLFMLFTTLMISLRWRGSFNGGSDFM